MAYGRADRRPYWDLPSVQGPPTIDAWKPSHLRSRLPLYLSMMLFELTLLAYVWASRACEPGTCGYATW